jgi:hypothetical protein
VGTLEGIEGEEGMSILVRLLYTPQLFWIMLIQ